MSENQIEVVIPTVIEATARGERMYDIFSLLLKERIVMLGTPITDQTANLIVAQLLFLDREDSGKEIQMFINSPGGVAYAGLAVYDTMQQIKSPVSTIAVGLAASFGTILLAAGAHGRRFALANATIHMHQPHGGAEGQASDIHIQAEEILRLRDSLEQIFVKHTGQKQEKIRHDLDRDIFLTPEQAVEYGLIDGILNGRNSETSSQARGKTESKEGGS